MDTLRGHVNATRSGRTLVLACITTYIADQFFGWHVTKRGTRFDATQALGMAVRQQLGHLSAAAAGGLAPRRDHGSNFMA